MSPSATGEFSFGVHSTDQVRLQAPSFEGRSCAKLNLSSINYQAALSACWFTEPHPNMICDTKSKNMSHLHGYRKTATAQTNTNRQTIQNSLRVVSCISIMKVEALVSMSSAVPESTGVTKLECRCESRTQNRKNAHWTQTSEWIKLKPKDTHRVCERFINVPIRVKTFLYFPRVHGINMDVWVSDNAHTHEKPSRHPRFAFYFDQFCFG